MISNVEMTSGEGWAFLDNVSDDACQVSKFAKNTPHVIHFCQRYSIGNCFWNKHLLPPPDILSCDCPLLELPPNDIAALVNYSRYGDGTIIYWDPDGRKLNRKYHNTYMICSIMPTLNKASMFFKDRHCPNGANYNQTWNHFSDYRPKDNL